MPTIAIAASSKAAHPTAKTPWNPAKLEQRIARAWRKNQMRTVSVVNLVTEDSIEHNILHLLGQKQALADGVLDGAGDLALLKMPSGRGAFIERMQAMMAASTRPAPRIILPEEALVADLVQRHGDKVLLVEARRGADARPKLLAVLDLDQPSLAAEAARLLSGNTLAVEVVDRITWLAMQRLAATGVLQFTHESRILHRSPAFNEEGVKALSTDTRGAELMAEAHHALRMANVLASGGFPEEAPALLAKALQKGAAARMAGRAELPVGASIATDLDIRRLIKCDALPVGALAILDATQPSAGLPRAGEINSLVSAIECLLAAIGNNDPQLRT